MKIKAVIKKLGEAKSGVSSRTGNAWALRNVVLQAEGESGVQMASVISCTAYDNDVVKYLNQCLEGDHVDAVVRFYSEQKTSKMGNEYWTLSAVLDGVKKDSEPF